MNNKLVQMDLSLSLNKEYESTIELKNDSLLIAEIMVTEGESLVYENVPFTISEVEVLNEYNGEIIEKSIKLLETGGIIDNKQFSINGNPTLNRNDRALVFLQKYEGPIVDNAYVITGDYQGKFLLNSENEVIDFDGSPKNLTDLVDSLGL
ncbi:hypothetical protein [Paenibacillus sp. NPDC093718]|uniref:hypothetical protein n=1 Tax=Paenibacillus sp. NPDC093718 TaxID=3390601 RepID=UPI003D0496A7